MDWQEKYNKDIVRITEEVKKYREEQEKKISELEQGNIYLKQQVATKNMQIKELRERLDVLEPRQKYLKSIETRRRFTEKEKKHMRRLHKQNNGNKMETLRQLKEEGISISYRHLGVILAEKKGK